MTDLNGGTNRIALARDVYVRAPGLVGTVELLPPRLLGTRDGEEERATPALTSALGWQGFTTIHSFEIDAREAYGPASPPNRGPDNRPLLTVEVPDLGPQQHPVALLADEEGVVTWNFPQLGAMPGSVRFDVPADTLTTPTLVQTDGQRGLVSLIGKKLLSILVFPLLEAGAEILAHKIAEDWEKKHRAPALRRFSQPEDLAPTAVPLGDQDWTSLADGRALLFVHGSCSTSHGGFAALGSDMLGQLSHRYGGRLFAYDHPTLSVHPLANAEALTGLIPPGMRVDVDILAHSRGGLVSRAIACAGIDYSFPLRVKRIVHVGVPNAGTALANVERYAQFADRLTTLLNLAPDGPLSVVADVLDGVLTVVKILGCSGLGTLPGLHAMDPANQWLSTLGSQPAPPYTGYAIDADFEPVGNLVHLMRLPNGIADKAFGNAANDIIVPAGGVYDPGSAVGFPIPSQRRLSYVKNDNVWHCSYFGQNKTTEALLRWLTPADPAHADRPQDRS